MTNDLPFPAYYVLVGHTPMRVSMEMWAEAMEKRTASIKGGTGDPWRVARTEVREACSVSTVFMGLDHQFCFGPGPGEPVLFETMIFGGPLDQEQGRYRTWQEAERGHAEAVARARKAVEQVDALAKAAGAKQDH